MTVLCTRSALKFTSSWANPLPTSARPIAASLAPAPAPEPPAPPPRATLAAAAMPSKSSNPDGSSSHSGCMKAAAFCARVSEEAWL